MHIILPLSHPSSCNGQSEVIKVAGEESQTDNGPEADEEDGTPSSPQCWWWHNRIYHFPLMISGYNLWPR